MEPDDEKTAETTTETPADATDTAAETPAADDTAAADDDAKTPDAT